MRFETRAYSKAGAKEFMRISESSVKLIKNPKTGLTNKGLVSVIVIILCITGFFACLVAKSFVKEAIIDFWAGAILVIGILMVFYRLRLTAMINSLTNPNRQIVFEMDKEGMELDDSQKVIRTKWGTYQGYRAFKHTLVFIPKSIQGQMCVFPIERRGELENFFGENKIKMKNLG